LDLRFHPESSAAQRLIADTEAVQRVMNTFIARPRSLKYSAGVVANFRQRWSTGIHCPSDTLFAFGASFLWLAIYNERFWQDAVHAMWHGAGSSGVFLCNLFVLVWCVQALLLLLLPSRRLMLATTSVLFVIAALSSYFASRYGVVMNKDMLRNVFETDAAEARGLMSSELIDRVVVLGMTQRTVPPHAKPIVIIMWWAKRPVPRIFN
jgi:hypothetical protein